MAQLSHNYKRNRHENARRRSFSFTYVVSFNYSWTKNLFLHLNIVGRGCKSMFSPRFFFSKKSFGVEQDKWFSLNRTFSYKTILGSFRVISSAWCEKCWASIVVSCHTYFLLTEVPTYLFVLEIVSR